MITKSKSAAASKREVFTEPVRRPDHIASYFRREWKTLLIVALSGTLFNMGQSLCAIRQGALVDAVAGQEMGKGGGLLRAAFLFLFTVLAVQLLRLAKRYYVRRFANATDISMRMMVYNSIIHEDYQHLHSENSGQIMTRALGDVDRTVEGMRKVTTEVFDTGVLLVTYFITMYHYSPVCTALACIPVPVALLAARFLKTFVEKYSRRAREMSALVAESSLDAVRNSLLYRVTGSEGRMSEAYEDQLARLEKEQTAAGVLENSMQPVYNAITLCGALTVIFYGGRLVLSGVFSVGTFTAYLTIYLAFALKVAKVSKLFNSFQKAKVSWARVRPYMTGWKSGDSDTGKNKARVSDVRPAGPRTEADILNFGNPTPITLFCRDVTISRDGKKELFSPVSFAGTRGQIIGITGPVACGKSTLGLALAGLMDYRGTIRVLGHDLSMLTDAWRASMISYMGHDPQLADLPIRDNILLGREEDEWTLRQVLSDVCLDEDLARMSENELTLTGSSGKALSGGQRSRVACARALYAHSPVIILDEPFANVDRETERKMIGRLRENHRDSLIIIISHRMSVFEKADLVLMIEDTGFVRTGTHESLMKESKRYRESYKMQQEEKPEDKRPAGGESHE